MNENTALKTTYQTKQRVSSHKKSLIKYVSFQHTVENEMISWPPSNGRWVEVSKFRWFIKMKFLFH